MKFPVKMIPFQEDMLSFDWGNHRYQVPSPIPQFKSLKWPRFPCLMGSSLADVFGEDSGGQLTYQESQPRWQVVICTCLVNPCKIDMGHEQTRTNQIEEMIGWYILAPKEMTFLTGFLDQLVSWSTHSTLAFPFLKLVIYCVPFWRFKLQTAQTLWSVIIYWPRKWYSKVWLNVRTLQYVFCDTLWDVFLKS